MVLPAPNTCYTLEVLFTCAKILGGANVQQKEHSSLKPLSLYLGQCSIDIKNDPVRVLERLPKARWKTVYSRIVMVLNYIGVWTSQEMSPRE